MSEMLKSIEPRIERFLMNTPIFEKGFDEEDIEQLNEATVTLGILVRDIYRELKEIKESLKPEPIFTKIRLPYSSDRVDIPQKIIDRPDFNKLTKDDIIQLMTKEQN